MSRALLLAISAALVGATGYGVMYAMDSKSAIDVGMDIKSAIDTQITKFNKDNVMIAQKYGGSDPHGADPHGDDPHDENHDPNLPANKERSFGRVPKDVYGGSVPNDQKPY